MLVLGIDPGTATTGFGLVQMTDDGYHVVDFGLIETAKESLPEIRLAEIYAQLLVILAKHKPDILVIEKVFFANNAKTAIRVGQAQGVMLLSAATVNIPVAEYAPGTIKKLITGDGRADKKQVQQSIRKYLGAKVRSKAHKKTHFDNAADALAVAMCHVFSIR